MTELIGVPAKEYPAFMAGLSFLPSLPPDEALMALRSRADALKVKLAGMRGAMKAGRDAGLPASSNSRRSTKSSSSPPS